MKNNDRSKGETGETAWCVARVSVMLVLAAALGTLASIKALLFCLTQRSGVFSSMGTGSLLLVTLANAVPVFLVALSWLWSFRPRTLFAKADVSNRVACFVMTHFGSQTPGQPGSTGCPSMG